MLFQHLECADIDWHLSKKAHLWKLQSLVELNSTKSYSSSYKGVCALQKTVSVPLISGRHQWTWTSAEPLECTSLSIKVRARDGQRASEWSNTQIHQGQMDSNHKLSKTLCFRFLIFKLLRFPSPCLSGYDIPSKPDFQMFPQDKVVPVGANTTFCCIVGEGMLLGSMNYKKEVVKTTRLSRRAYSTVVVNQLPSNNTGNNIVCHGNPMGFTGSVIFAGCKTKSFDYS